MFLDELTEFSRDVLEALTVWLSRRSRRAERGPFDSIAGRLSTAYLARPMRHYAWIVPTPASGDITASEGGLRL